MEKDDDYCTGQCGYGPRCPDCMREKQRRWDEYLIVKKRQRESSEESGTSFGDHDKN
jgi:hypothetical protein